MPTTTVSELKAFHTTDRDMYRRLVDDTELDPSSAKHIMALWLFLETISFEGTGYADVVQKAASYDNNALSLLGLEAEYCIAFMRNGSESGTLQKLSSHYYGISQNPKYLLEHISMILGLPISILDFTQNSWNHVCQNWKNICRKVFDFDEVPVCRTESLNEEAKSWNLEATTPIDEARTQSVDSTGYSNEEWAPPATLIKEQAEPIQDVIFEDEESMARHLLGDLLMYL
ncbi:hypothetical protein AMTR_s00006p00265720 [Amborella trichopoda]|uniref:Uncharacterized protein n=1 Tax=Amborella trichopoda TaxID=13333 RepID=W1P7M8_AMBTC|nr:hypothetical protein AMTR_s00006p00265720 [Amborella trichopoda]